MNRTANKQRRLRQLSPAELRTATGGIIMFGSTALGGPDTSGMIIHGAPDPAEGAIIFWRPMYSGG